jgi:ATP-dependent RNA helicase DHX37/DHR1
MSATLRVADFAENKTLFPVAPPIINISARQHSVTIHFNRRTASDYITEAVKKASKIHSKLPPGGILIFLTGQNEITGVCRKLEAKYGRRALAAQKRRRMGLGLPDVDVGGAEEPRTVVARQGEFISALPSS